MHLPFDILKIERDGGFRWFEAANDPWSAQQPIEPPEPIPQPAPEPAPEPAPPEPQSDSKPKDRAVILDAAGKIGRPDDMTAWH
ncbi:MAG TPA: hypothetical protein VHM88_25835 [Candidatus Acidoferrales bacterium]|jgi:hypothetical protein|nr:hypothetical protein [Candidatus Acidoferrales bacterium]